MVLPVVRASHGETVSILRGAASRVAQFVLVSAAAVMVWEMLVVTRCDDNRLFNNEQLRTKSHLADAVVPVRIAGKLDSSPEALQSNSTGTNALVAESAPEVCAMPHFSCSLALLLEATGDRTAASLLSHPHILRIGIVIMCVKRLARRPSEILILTFQALHQPLAHDVFTCRPPD
jgi:hypothetical protein